MRLRLYIHTNVYCIWGLQVESFAFRWFEENIYYSYSVVCACTKNEWWWWWWWQNVCGWKEHKTTSLCACVCVRVCAFNTLLCPDTVSIGKFDCDDDSDDGDDKSDGKEKKRGTNIEINRFPFSGHCFTSRQQQQLQ